MMVATVPGIDDRVMGRERLWAMLHGLLDELRTKLGMLDLSRGGCEVYLVLPESRPGLTEDDTQWLCQRTHEQLAARRILARVMLGGRGHAGCMAVLEAVSIQASRSSQSLYVVIGLDSYIDLATFDWLETNGRFAQPHVRTGFVPGEGAGALVVASAVTRKALRWPNLGTIAGVATARETLLRDSETGSFGRGLTEAVERATQGIRSAGRAADDVYSDINGERYRSEEWGFLAMRAHAVIRRLEYQSLAHCWGEVGAASGVLSTIAGACSLQRGYAAGPTVLVTCGSDGGLRGAMVIEDPSLRS